MTEVMSKTERRGTTRIYIHAGNYDEFLVAKRHLSSKAVYNYVYISGSDQLRGLHKSTVYLYGNYANHPEHPLIMLTLTQNYAEIHMLTEHTLAESYVNYYTQTYSIPNGDG